MSDDREAIKLIPVWDGDAGTFQRDADLLTDAMAMLNVTIVPALNVFDGDPPSIDSDASAYKRQNTKAWVAISIFIRGVGRDDVIAGYDASRNLSSSHAVILDAPPTTGVGTGLARSAARLWLAVISYSNGAIPDVAGTDLLAAIDAVSFPSTGTYAARAKSVLDRLVQLIAVATRLGDSDYSFSGIRACHKFRQLMPERFQREYSTYESIRSLPALRLRAMRDAARFDDEHAVPTGQTAQLLAALGISTDSPIDPVVLAHLKDLGHRATRPPRTVTPRMLNRSAGPPEPGQTWCDHPRHGWCKHKTADCATLKKEGGSGADDTLYRRNTDGTFSKLAGADRTKLGLCATVSTGISIDQQEVLAQCYGMPPVPTTTAGLQGVPAASTPGVKPRTASGPDNGHLDRVALTTGINLQDYVIIDTGAQIDLSTTVAQHPEAVALARPMLLDGATTGPRTHITHKRTVDYNLGSFGHTATVHGPAKCNIAAACNLARNGVSMVIDARDPDAPRMYLYRTDSADGQTPVVEATRIGDLWALPLSNASGAPAGTASNVNLSARVVAAGVGNAGVSHDTAYRSAGVPTTNTTGAGAVSGHPGDIRETDITELAAAAAATAAAGGGELPTRDYRSFRLRFAGGSDRRAVSLAKKMGVELTGRTRVVRGELDRIQRLANAKNGALRPLRTIGSGNAADGAIEHIILDTIGNKLRKAASGNNSALVIVRQSDPSGVYHVVCAPDHSAATTWASFERWAQFRSLDMAREAIAQPVTLYTDNGSEFMGEFGASVRRAGMRHMTSVANKHVSGRQAFAESAAGLAQRDQRRGVEAARANFAALGHDSEDYYDHALVYGGVASLRNSEASRNIISQEELERLIPAEWGAQCIVTVPAAHPLNKRVIKQHAHRGLDGVFLGARGSKYAVLTASGYVIHTTEVNFDIAAAISTGSTEPIQQPATAAGSPAVSFADHDVIGNTAGDDVAPDLISDAEESDSEDEDGHTFTDNSGTTIRIGDRVSILWTGDGVSYSGEVTGVDHNDATVTGGSFSVSYDDGDSQTHSISEVQVEQVTALAASATRGTARVRLPASSIKDEITVHPDGSWDVREDLLLGRRQYVAPPLPKIRQEDLPPPPRGTTAALSDEFWAPHHLAAMLREYRGHADPPARQPVFEFTSESSSSPPMREVWVHRFKCKNGWLDSVKARCSCDGSSGVRGVTYHESYVGTAPIDDVRRMESRAVNLGWYTGELDWTQAYCQHVKVPRPDGQQSLVTPAVGMRTYANGRVLKKRLVSELYGDGQAGHTHTKGATDSLLRRNQPPGVPLCPLQIEQSPHQPTIFKAVFPAGDPRHGEHLQLYLHNDNLRAYTSDWSAFLVLRAWAMQRWEITGSDEPMQKQTPQELLGMTVTYGPGRVSLTMEGFVTSAVCRFNCDGCKPTDVPMTPGFSLSKLDYCDTDSERIELRSKVNKMFSVSLRDATAVRHYYAEIVSTIGWVARQVAPILLLAHSMLGRAMADPSVKAFKAAHQVLRYLSGHRGIGITYVRPRVYDWRRGDWPDYLMETDASFADDASNRRSQGGYLGHYRDCAVDTAQSAQHKTVTTSTFHAESTQATAAAKQARYVKMVDDWLGVTKNDAIPLAIDNAATVLATAGPSPKFSPKSKHFDISARYITELVELGYIRPYHVRGEVTADHRGLQADALTKPLSGKLIAHHAALIQGPSPARGAQSAP